VNTPLKNKGLSEKLHPSAIEGIELFNLKRFYKAHEPLELAWMDTDPPERYLYQGILQIGLAYFQITRGSYRGAIKMFRRGHRNLESLEDQLMGIDIKRLRSDARIVERKIRKLGQGRSREFPREEFPFVPFIKEQKDDL
jgi:predicted metal-dependent hydrolase